MTELLPTIGSIVLRAAVIYGALLVLLRLAGRRELAQLTPADVLLLLLLSESVSPSLTAGHDSVWTGLLSAGMLIALTWLIGWLTFRSKRFEALVEGNPLVLVRHGKIDVDQLRSLRITDQQMRTFLHEHGLLRMDQVGVAYVEPSGRVTIVKEGEQPEPKGARGAGEHGADGSDGSDEAASIAAIRRQLDELEQKLAAQRAGRQARKEPAGAHA